MKSGLHKASSCPPTDLSLHGKGNLKGVVHRMMSSVSDHPSVTVPVLSRSREMTLACIAHVHGVNTVEKSYGSSGQCGTIPHPGHAGVAKDWHGLTHCLYFLQVPASETLALP